MSGHVCDPATSWALLDARGIYCCRVCDVCEGEKKARYRADIFEDIDYWHDEPINGD